MWDKPNSNQKTKDTSWHTKLFKEELIRIFMQEYTIEKTAGGVEITRWTFKEYPIHATKITEGFCRAEPNNPRGLRTTSWYDKNVLRPMIDREEISDGSTSRFDDRKMRYDGSTIEAMSEGGENILEVRLGHSHFLEYKEKRTRALEETQRLTQLGTRYLHDQYAFFPRNPGVTSIIKTIDKKIIVGQRKVQTDPQYDGLLQGAAGHLNFHQNPLELSLYKEAVRELVEETGLSKKQIIRGCEFLGLFSDPSVGGDDLDFTYLFKTNLPSDYFTSGTWQTLVAEKQREHSKFFAIPNYDSLQKIVNEGLLEGRKFDIVFSTRGPLAALTPNDFE